MGRLWILLWYWSHPLFHLSLVVSPKKKKKKSNSLCKYPFKPLRFNLVHLIQLDPFRSNFDHFGPRRSIQSSLVIFSFWSILVHFSPLGILQSTGSIQSTLVIHSFWSIFVYFGPLGILQSIWSFCSIRSTLVSDVQFIRSFWFTSVQFRPFGSTWSICSSLVHFVRFNLLFPNRNLAVLSMPELS